ncbi:MAG TPA: hypothetical protein VGV15_00260 [Terriglobales bacterium]|nr:hypothetical protein [Terriglobales bacterium]
MEPIRNTKTIRFGRLKMYREDLDALVAVFQRACSHVTISDDKNRYDSLDEMKKYIGSRVKDFNIRGDNPKVHFLLNKAEQVPASTPGQFMTYLFPELRTEEATDAADNLFFVVKDFLQGHQRTALTAAFLICSIIVMALTLALGILGVVKHDPSVTPALGGASLFAGCVLLIFILIWSNRGHSLILDTKLESPSFFAKNREEFGEQAVTATISGLIGVVIGYLFGHGFK